jgi:non-heme chloroperoxidase
MKEYFLNGSEIYYRTNEFKPDRLTLVFIHGVSGSSSAWLPYEPIFQNKYNVLIYDIRGHGMSKKFPNYSDYEIKNFANDLHKLVSYLNISKFILINNSFAALISLEYIKLWRETVIGNVFTSPEVYLGEGLKASIFRFILKVITGILKIVPFNPKPRGHVDYRRYVGDTDWAVGRNWADLRNTGAHADFYSLRQSMRKGQEYDLEKITVPTLVMHGKKDSMVPIKNAIMLSEKIKNSEFVSIPNVDHNTAHNAVKEMSEAIESFIEKNKAAFSKSL